MKLKIISFKLVFALLYGFFYTLADCENLINNLEIENLVSREETCEENTDSAELVVLKLLEKYKNDDCLVYEDGSYWGFIFCYDRFVSQYPALKSSKSKVKNTLLLGLPNQKSIVFQENVLTLSYKNGDICEEKESSREAIIKLSCCDRISGSYGQSKLQIQAVKETSLCIYQLDVCVPELCYIPLISDFDSLLKEPASTIELEARVLEKVKVSRSSSDRKRYLSEREIACNFFHLIYFRLS